MPIHEVRKHNFCQFDVMVRLTGLLSAEALLAFGSGSEVGVADGLVDKKLPLFGWRHSFGGRAGQRGAFALLDQAVETTRARC